MSLINHIGCIAGNGLNSRKCRWFRWGRRLRLVASNAVVAGVEVASAVAFSVVPPLMLKSGFRESTMSILFGIGEQASIS